MIQQRIDPAGVDIRIDDRRWRDSANPRARDPGRPGFRRLRGSSCLCVRPVPPTSTLQDAIALEFADSTRFRTIPARGAAPFVPEVRSVAEETVVRGGAERFAVDSLPRSQAGGEQQSGRPSAPKEIRVRSFRTPADASGRVRAASNAATATSVSDLEGVEPDRGTDRRDQSPSAPPPGRRSASIVAPGNAGDDAAPARVHGRGEDRFCGQPSRIGTQSAVRTAAIVSSVLHDDRVGLGLRTWSGRSTTFGGMDLGHGRDAASPSPNCALRTVPGMPRSSRHRCRIGDSTRAAARSNNSIVRPDRGREPVLKPRRLEAGSIEASTGGPRL